MSANPANPLHDIEAFKDQMRRHCEQRRTEVMAGSPLLGRRPVPVAVPVPVDGRSHRHHYHQHHQHHQHRGQESSLVVGSPNLRRSSDEGQMRPNVVDSGSGFVESQPIKVHPHLKIKVSEIRRSNGDGLEHQPMFPEGNDQLMGPPARMGPPYTEQRNYGASDPFVGELARPGADNNQAQQMMFPGDDHFMRPPPTYSMISKHFRQQNAQDEVTASQEEFRVDLDVTGYAPEELDVKIVGNDVVIRGSRRAERRAGEIANVSQAFNRQYTLPDNVLVDGVSVLMSRNGMLSVKVPRKTAAMVVAPEPIIAPRQTKVKFLDEQ